jgi:hypothetical protein
MFSEARGVGGLGSTVCAEAATAMAAKARRCKLRARLIGIRSLKLKFTL